MLTKEEFWAKARYVYEIAAFLGVDRRTLVAWIVDLECAHYQKNKKLYSPKEVRSIIEYLGS